MVVRPSISDSKYQSKFDGIRPTNFPTIAESHRGVISRAHLLNNGSHVQSTTASSVSWSEATEAAFYEYFHSYSKDNTGQTKNDMFHFSRNEEINPLSAYQDSSANFPIPQPTFPSTLQVPK